MIKYQHAKQHACYFVYTDLILFYSIVSKGNSHNLMKAGANRRRSKLEIKAAKLAEQERIRDIEAKMQEHTHMQAQLAEAELEIEGL